MIDTILAPIRQTLDHHVQARVLPDGSGVDDQGAAKIVNPFDEIALEAALRLKEQGVAARVVAAVIGPAETEKALRTALAMGADAAALVEVEELPEPPRVAQALAALARREGAELVIMGKQAIDDDLGVTAQMLAARLGWPQAMFAAELRVEDGVAHVLCEADAGTRTLKAPLPCVVAADLRLAEPRFVSLANVMKAKRKPIERLSAAEVGLEVAEAHTPLLKVEATRRRRAGEMLADVDALIATLRQRGLWPEGQG